MKTTLVNLMAPITAIHRPSLTPELMAAVGARYSRNGEGLENILSKVDLNNPDKSIDSIFNLISYGHSSIADMAPVAIFIDDISLLLTFWLWHICYTASGQESSTRYIRYSKEGMLDYNEVNLDKMDLYTSQSHGYLCYEKSYSEWEAYGKLHPEEMGIPENLKFEDEKKYLRMVRNYAFDRARCFLPLSARTNVMMVMSARSWVDLISYLLSFPAKEFNKLGEMLKNELNLATPRLMQFTVPKASTTTIIKDKITNIQEQIKRKDYRYDSLMHNHGGYLEIIGECDYNPTMLECRENRYSIFDDSLRMTPVRFGWDQVSIGEIRDMNRHRTGQKNFSWIPNGFYSASDVAPEELALKLVDYHQRPMKENFDKCIKYLGEGNIEGLYLLNLGHTFGYEHVTTMDKFIYQMELRTGIGCHYAYKRMMLEFVPLLEKQLPGITKHMKINEELSWGK